MHPLRLAERAGKIRPFYVMELLERAKRMEAGGRHIIHMEVGEPDFPTPRLIKERAIGAIGDNRTYYTHSLGLPELREAIELVDSLKQDDISILMVEHVMDAVHALCSRCVVMNAGTKIADGPTARVLKEPEVVRAYLGEDVSADEDQPAEARHA